MKNLARRARSCRPLRSYQPNFLRVRLPNGARGKLDSLLLGCVLGAGLSMPACGGGETPPDDGDVPMTGPEATGAVKPTSPGASDGQPEPPADSDVSPNPTDVSPSSGEGGSNPASPADNMMDGMSPDDEGEPEGMEPDQGMPEGMEPDEQPQEEPGQNNPDLPAGTHPDIVKIIDVKGRNPGGDGWKDSYSVGTKCYCASTFDHNIGGLKVETPAGTKTVREVCNKIGKGPGQQGRPIYNDIQCGNGPYNNAGDEEDCPGRVDIGRKGCGHIGPKWDLSVYE